MADNSVAVQTKVEMNLISHNSTCDVIEQERKKVNKAASKAAQQALVFSPRHPAQLENPLCLNDRHSRQTDHDVFTSAYFYESDEVETFYSNADEFES